MCRDAYPTSDIRVEIQVKSGLFRLGKEEQGSKEIDCQELFKDYWDTTDHEFPVRGQSESPVSLTSLTEKTQRTLSSGNIVVLWNYNSLQKSLFVFWQFPPHAAYRVHIDGFVTLLSAETRRNVKGLLPTDE